MDNPTPRQAYSWDDWSRDTNKHIRDAQKRLATLENIIFGDLNKTLAEGGTPRIITLIENVCRQMLADRKVMRDAGVWDVERQYEPGAAVTYDGAVWACQVQNKGAKPGDGVMWRLMHKTADVQLLKQIRTVVRDEVRKQLVEKGK